jgi:hypothetical protein
VAVSRGEEMTTDWRDEIIKLGPLSPGEQKRVKHEPWTVAFHDINGMPVEITMIIPVIRGKKK